ERRRQEDAEDSAHAGKVEWCESGFAAKPDPEIEPAGSSSGGDEADDAFDTVERGRDVEAAGRRRRAHAFPKVRRKWFAGEILVPGLAHEDGAAAVDDGEGAVFAPAGPLHLLRQPVEADAGEDRSACGTVEPGEGYCHVETWGVGNPTLHKPPHREGTRPDGLLDGVAVRR